MPTTLVDIEQLAKQQFLLLTGTRVFDIPCKQLYEYNTRGELRVLQTSEFNREEIAKLSLNFKDCDRTKSGVNLRDSLELGEDGKTTLVNAMGCKLLSAIQINEDDG